MPTMNQEIENRVQGRQPGQKKWWRFWLGGGILLVGIEFIGNALAGNFPLLLTMFPDSPLLSLTGNAVFYGAVILTVCLLFGALIELARRLVRTGPEFHLAAAIVLLLAAAIYLSYGVIASSLERVDPSVGLPEGYHPPLTLWWSGIGIAAVAVALVLGYGTGFFRRWKLVISWLVILVPAVAAFNIVDHAINAALPRVWLLIIILAGVVLCRLILKKLNPSPGRVIAAVGIITGVVIVIQGVYFGWPGSGYDHHLVCMIWDAQPAKRMSVYGYDITNTPYLSELRNQMIIFKQAYSPANYTFASHVSIFTGRYIREHHLYDGTVKESRLYANFTNLADALAAKGYRPLLLTENPWLMPISSGFETAISCPTRSQAVKYFLPFYRDSFLGIQLFDHLSFLSEDDFKWSVIRIEKRYLSDWLLRARRNGPYFIFTNWMYFHSRYCPTVSEEIFHDDLPQQAYDDCIRFMDSYLRDWVDTFKCAGQIEETLFLLTADHGDFLGEFGMYGHGKTLLEPVLHVPLLLFGEPIQPEFVSTPVPLVALKPALDALVPEKPGAGWQVRDFINRLLNNRGMVVEGSFDFEGPGNSIRWFLAAWEGTKKYMQDTHKYIPGHSEGLDMDSFYFLYELDSDPGEKHNLARERLSEVDYMQEKIREWEDNLEPVQLPPPEEGEEGDYPPGLVEQLRALGYMR